MVKKKSGNVVVKENTDVVESESEPLDAAHWPSWLKKSIFRYHVDVPIITLILFKVYTATATRFIEIVHYILAMLVYFALRLFFFRANANVINTLRDKEVVPKP